jgi:tight adherence protein B
MDTTVLAITSAMWFAAAVLATYSIQPVWDRIARRYVIDLKPQLDSLSISPQEVDRYLRIWGLSLLGTFLVLTFVLRMLPLAVVCMYIVYVAPRILLQVVIDRRKSLIRDQMVGATVALANTCRAGLSLAQGMTMVANEAPEPLASELRRISGDFEHGRPLAESILDTKQRLNLDSFTLFASAVLVSLDRGGRVTDALDRISHSLQENQRLERKLDSDTASGKAVVWILTLFPVLFLGIVFLMAREQTMMVFQSLIGQFVLAAVFILVYISLRWSQRILALQV